MSGAIENSRYKSYVKSYVSSRFTSYLVHNRSSMGSIMHRTYCCIAALSECNYFVSCVIPLKKASSSTRLLHYFNDHNRISQLMIQLI